MGRIQTRIAAVIKLLDYYTGQPIDIKNVKVSVKQQNKVIMKQGGFVVLLESPGVKVFNILIESAIYQTKEIVVAGENCVLQKGCPVWLQTKKGYPFGGGVTILKGRAVDETCMISWENKERPIRLMADYEAGSDVICLANAGEYIEGRYYRIETKENGETFILAGEIAEQKQGYLLEKPCSKNYKRTESLVTPMLPISVMNKEFYFGIADIPKEGTVCKLYKQGICVKEIRLEHGKENLLEW